jgi:hypothetical protein
MKVGNFGRNLNVNKREDKSKKQGAKSKFINLVTLFDSLDKRSFEIESFGIDMSDYEDAHFTLIENLIFEIYGEWKTQLIMWYVYERLDEEGNLLPLFVSEVDEETEDEDEEEGEEVYIKTPEQLYDFIKKLEKQEKK